MGLLKRDRKTFDTRLKPGAVMIRAVLGSRGENDESVRREKMLGKEKIRSWHRPASTIVEHDIEQGREHRSSDSGLATGMKGER